MKHFFTSITLLFLLSCKASNTNNKVIIIAHDDKNITYEGRIGKSETKQASELYWSGTSLKVNFNGISAKAILEDQNGTNYYNIIIDNQKIDVLKLKKGKHTYILADNLSSGQHSIELTKRNEWTYGTTLFYGFEIFGSKVVPPNEKKPLSIEFYGDSITTGHGNEDYSGEDKPDGNVTNNYMTYAAMTARTINAEYTCIARGGIGIMVSWFNMIMPEMYDRLNPNDATSKWDFKKHPDIVVVNLFQNDSWIVNHPEHEEFKRRFGKQKPSEKTIINDYQSFIKKIRTHYPKASIVCLLGNMDVTKEKSKWPSYVTSAIDQLKDNNIFTCFVPFKNTKGHPKVEEHQIIAKKLTTIIKSDIIKK
ncbi:electron transporter RnfD [Aquimarina sp. AD10]|uniref:Carbohydrate esterase 2 N-terminal domain-containing protein n=1 Tax=Aquimarina aggregata TaxID=1642818 RepID=A0A162X419_9FLAO|nr:MULTISPECIES: SGNH/GDSL hydrolase family protein [Aquimarina]AXT60532.1 electron transporter RnfD [Aquimarina sp. AD10]KZS38408.1 hypothetical protein AWE51_17785 [Aquimarina aggregata]RKN01623.1 electron transporter RnfD [Aquimarina sp. AD10]